VIQRLLLPLKSESQQQSMLFILSKNTDHLQKNIFLAQSATYVLWSLRSIDAGENAVYRYVVTVSPVTAVGPRGRLENPSL
jgi:hypothetical protein